MKAFNVDERTSQVAGRVSAVVLALTQVALAAAVLFRAYVLDQPDREFADLRLILLFSIFGNIFASLYFGGVYPVLKIRNLVRIYLISVVSLSIILSLWLGPPDLS